MEKIIITNNELIQKQVKCKRQNIKNIFYSFSFTMVGLLFLPELCVSKIIGFSNSVLKNKPLLVSTYEKNYILGLGNIYEFMFQNICEK